jgi:hypothetical protein
MKRLFLGFLAIICFLLALAVLIISALPGNSLQVGSFMVDKNNGLVLLLGFCFVGVVLALASNHSK